MRPVRTQKRAILVYSLLTTISLPCVLSCRAQSSAAPEPPGCFAGDAHVHRGIGCGRSKAKEMLTPQELLEGMQTNNLAVVSVLADLGNGEMKYAEKDIPLITGEDNRVSTPQRILHWDAEWHYDPKGVTFEQKMIGGHLIMLGLKKGKTMFSEYTYPLFDWARKQGAIIGFAHLQYLTDDIPAVLDCCKPLELPVETALGDVSFVMEDVHGSDTAIHAYYRLLNCGFRPGLVASTDYSCNFLEPFGTLLTYVYIPGGQLNYRQWIDGIARGRTVVSRDAHNEFLELKVNGGAVPGDEIRLSHGGPIQVRVRWTTTKNLTGTIEIVRNGKVVASRVASASAGFPAVFETAVDFPESGWLCARRMDQKGHQTHTGPVFVIVKGAPVRASASDAEYFVSWIDNLIKQTSPGGEWNHYFSKDFEAAQTRYRRAREIYERIASEARTMRP